MDSPRIPRNPSEFRNSGSFLRIPLDSPGIPQNSGILVYSCGFPWNSCPFLWIPPDSCPFLWIPAGISGGMKSIVNVCRYSFQHSKALKTLTTMMWTGRLFALTFPFIYVRSSLFTIIRQITSQPNHKSFHQCRHINGGRTL